MGVRRGPVGISLGSIMRYFPIDPIQQILGEHGNQSQRCSTPMGIAVAGFARFSGGRMVRGIVGMGATSISRSWYAGFAPVSEVIRHTPTHRAERHVARESIGADSCQAARVVGTRTGIRLSGSR
jgi:hypothetical protein